MEEWGDIDGTAAGKQFIEKAESTTWKGHCTCVYIHICMYVCIYTQSAVAVHEDFNKLLFPQRILVPFNIKTIHHFDVSGHARPNHYTSRWRSGFSLFSIPCTFLIKILIRTIWNTSIYNILYLTTLSSPWLIDTYFCIYFLIIIIFISTVGCFQFLSLNIPRTC